MTDQLTIGQLAKAAGVNVETIRYYQRLDLVKEPRKPVDGYRRYPGSDIGRLQFIKRAQDLGFTLREIADLLSLDDGSCREAREMAEHKLNDIEQRISDLDAIKVALKKLVKECRAQDKNSGHCALIEALSKGG